MLLDADHREARLVTFSSELLPIADDLPCCHPKLTFFVRAGKAFNPRAGD